MTQLQPQIAGPGDQGSGEPNWQMHTYLRCGRRTGTLRYYSLATLAAVDLIVVGRDVYKCDLGQRRLPVEGGDSKWDELNRSKSKLHSSVSRTGENKTPGL